MPKKIIETIFSYLVKNKILSLILFLALLLRVIGFPGYSPYHSDEGMSYSSAIEMIKRANIDPGRYDYPSLIPLIHALVYLVVLLPFSLVFSFIFAPENIPSFKSFFDLLVRFLVVNQQTMVLFWGRFLTGLFGVGVVFLVYQVSVKYFIDKRIGLVAAFLTAVNFRQVLNSHLGLPDIYNAFFMLFSFYVFSHLLKTPSLKNYLLSSVAWALYFSTKFQIFVIPAFLIIHTFNSLKSTRNRLSPLFFKNLFSRKILLSTVVGALIILAINYADLVHWKEFRDINSYNLLKYGVGAKQLNFYPVSYLYHVGIGQIISLSIILGILLGFFKYSFRTIILMSAIVPFLYTFFYYTRGGYYTRNFVTITPLLLIFAGVFIVNFWSWLLKKSTLVNLAVILSVLTISISQINHSLVVATSYIKPWNFEQARNWAAINIPNKSKLVSHPWDKYPRDKDYEIIPLEPSTIFSIAEMRDEGGEYGFINLDWLSLSSYWWINRSTQDSLLFWNKPDTLLSNTFGGVTAKELASYAVTAFIKPWQAPEMNILIAKIPGEPEIDKTLLTTFDFNNKDSSLEDWSLVNGDYSATSGISYDSREGHEAHGSIKIEAGTRRFPIILAASPVLVFEKNRAVVVEGWIKADSQVTKNRRDGFLRVDFYKDKLAKIHIDTVSAYSAISPRYFGEGWIKHKIFVIPPSDTRFLTVSVQSNGSTNFWFDDISIFLSKDSFKDPRKSPPFIDYQIPNEILFPYSQGGL